MNIIRTKLDDKEFNSALHELASEGSRISVEVEHMNMLQIELDSRGWSSKAKKWLPVINNIPVAGLLGRRDSQDSAVAETMANRRADSWKKSVIISISVMHSVIVYKGSHVCQLRNVQCGHWTENMNYRS
jgi:hypothetical protein